jgi:CMP-N-acetylneuraminic acid synthetase
MIDGRRVLAVVPARSGSKGIPDKNMAAVGGVSLIGLAGRALAAVPLVDARVISTDSPAYAAEGRRHGLDAPFLRPPELSGDAASAVDTMVHAVEASERHFGGRFDVVLIVEPTSPLRRPGDVERCVRALVDGGADSAVAVSPLPAKFHPHKILTGDGGAAGDGAGGGSAGIGAGTGRGPRLGFYTAQGATVVGRQELAGGFYYRNGVCYALTRACLMDRRTIFTEHTVGVVIDWPT